MKASVTLASKELYTIDDKLACNEQAKLLSSFTQDGEMPTGRGAMLAHLALLFHANDVSSSYLGGHTPSPLVHVRFVWPQRACPPARASLTPLPWAGRGANSGEHPRVDTPSGHQRARGRVQPHVPPHPPPLLSRGSRSSEVPKPPPPQWPRKNEPVPPSSRLSRASRVCSGLAFVVTTRCGQSLTGGRAGAEGE